MDCIECDRLSRECARLELAHADAVKTLLDRIDTLSAAENTRLREIAVEVRIDSEIAHTELEQHQRIHAKAS
jgi:hypothetical protein